MKEWNCLQCNKIFRDYPANRKGKLKFCSRKCKGLYQSTRYLGKNNPCWRGGIPKCLDCGKEVTQRFYKRCNNCDLKTGNHRRTHGLSKTRDYKNIHIRMAHLKRKGVKGHHTVEEWLKLKKTYKYMCLCCKRQEPEIKLSEDHIVPIVKGGTDDIWNIQPLCMRCNNIKYTKTIDYRYNVL